MSGEKRDAHLKRSLEPLLTFGNDADDMRSAGKAIDPRVNIGDLSGDTLAWSEQRLALVAETMVMRTSASKTVKSSSVYTRTSILYCDEVLCRGNRFSLCWRCLCRTWNNGAIL